MSNDKRAIEDRSRIHCQKAEFKTTIIDLDVT